MIFLILLCDGRFEIIFPLSVHFFDVIRQQTLLIYALFLSFLKGSSNLAWSYSVINFALQRMLKNPLFSKEDFGLDYSARVALSDSLHIMQQSAAVFKLMVRMLKTPTESQLLSFLRKLKKLLQAVNIGET